MIQTAQRNSIVLEDGDQEIKSIKMSIDWESEEFLMQTLSKNFYADGIGSTCRELASNALDSHRRANVTDIPIIVSFKRTTNGNYEFSVEDRGVGLDYNDVINIISKYGKSTARGVEGLLGMMGYGFKAPMSYTSSFIFIIRKDGIERKCMMYDGEDGMKIDLLDEDSTNEPNGVRVIVPVNSYDASNFYNKIKEQLCYFESIYFDVPYSSGIDNSFKITRYDDFQMSELNEDNSLHICLDNVYYPLDFKKLGITAISVPIALRFGLSDGIYPTPNREQLRYSTEAKAIILKKIEAVATKLVDIYNQSVQDTDDFEKIIDHYSSNHRYIDIGHKQKVEITDIVRYSNTKMRQPKLKGISILDLEKIVSETHEITSEYQVAYELRRGKIRERKGTSLQLYHFSNNTIIYKFADKLGGNKREYLKSISSGRVYFVKKKKTRKLFPDKTKQHGFYGEACTSYYTLLGLSLHPRDTWRQRIKEFILIQEKILSRIKDADAIDVPKAWLDSRKAAKIYIGKKKNGHQKLEGEISCKRAENLERYVDGRNCKFTPFSIDLKKLSKTNMIYIYTSHEDANKLDKLYSMSAKHKRTLVTFSEREMKKVNEFDVHNLISYEKFMKGDTSLFKKLVTAYLIDELMNKNSHVFNNSRAMAAISTKLSKKLDNLNTYVKTNYNSGSSLLYMAMVEIATNYSLFDNSIYQDYIEVKETLDKFPFLETIYNRMYSSYDEVNRNRIIIDLLKYNKYKINLEHYKKPTTEEAITEIVNN